MSILPVVLTVGIDNSKSEDLIKSIISQDNINNDTQDGYNWKIDNKYYTADVQFRLVDCKTSGKSIEHHVEAVLIYIDHIVVLGSLVQELSKWKTVARNVYTETKILVFKHSIPKKQKSAVNKWCSNNENGLFEVTSNEDQTPINALDDERNPIDNWCKENGFEFIELGLSEDMKPSNTPNGEEIIGLQRVVEALQVNHWSNLQLKKKAISKNLKHTDQADKIQTNDVLATSSNSKNETIPGNSACSVPVIKDFDDFEDFDKLDELFELFQNLNSLKANVSSLSGAEKLDEAEKLVKTFWNTIGGDMDEFSDSDDEVTFHR